MQTTFTALWPRGLTRRPGFSPVYSVKSYGAQGGTRTHTPERIAAFEAAASTIPPLGQIKTHLSVPRPPASVGSSCRTNSRTVFLNPQDWGVLYADHYRIHRFKAKGRITKLQQISYIS